MENKKLKSGLQALAMSGVVIVFAACKSNNDYTKNPAESETAPANTDTTMKNAPMKTGYCEHFSGNGTKSNLSNKEKGKSIGWCNDIKGNIKNETR